MRVSIRELLALTFVVVLAMLVWRSLRESQRDQERLDKLHSEVADLEMHMQLNRRDLRQAFLRTHDQYQAVRDLRERTVEHFALLREKYSSIEPQGGGILSLRSIPSLQQGEAPAPVVLRLWVPADRAIWLKYGVHLVQRNTGSSRESEKVDDLLTDSAIEDSGPFELRLAAGDQWLEIVTESADQGRVPFTIMLDDKRLLRSAFVFPRARGTNVVRISGKEQYNYHPQRPLPWLLSTRMQLDDHPMGTDQTTTLAFSLWLSDHTSDFAKFPGS